MSDPRETLADQVVRTAMIQLGRDTPVGFWAPTENATRKAVTAVLRELAAKPDGYLRYEEDGGITYTKTLLTLADHIEGGVEAPTTNPEPPANWEPAKGDPVVGLHKNAPGQPVRGVFFCWGTPERKTAWIDDGIGEISSIWPVTADSLRPVNPHQENPK